MNQRRGGGIPGKKALAQRIHAKRRMLERFGVVMNRKDLHEIALIIRNNKARFSCRKSHRVTRWIVEKFYKLPPMVVIYDSRRGQVVTVMPYEGSKEERHDQRDTKRNEDKVQSVQRPDNLHQDGSGKTDAGELAGADDSGAEDGGDYCV